MSSAKLAKLESLSEEQAEYSRDLVERQRAELSQLDSHHSDLKRINQEYQNAIVGVDGVSPQQLALRRSFVSQLTSKLDDLNQEKARKNVMLQESINDFHEQSAQTAAISSLVEREVAKESLSHARLLQMQENETTQSMRQLAIARQEEDHV
ncbi:MAG: hypothetical protein AB8B84_11195 [Granulosicoccus sp.]